jgi:8-oxo-dGTP pyrophosphatase MutT (NUDIX family)
VWPGRAAAGGVESDESDESDQSDESDENSAMTSRRAARVLLLDWSDRVLLLHGHDPARPDEPYWFTVGGGLDPGETPAQAAARELAEEVGLVVSPQTLDGPVWRQVIRFPFGGRWYEQEQDFFLLRVPRPTQPEGGALPEWEVSATGRGALEVATIDGHRWWSRAELRTTTEKYYPDELPDLLEGMLER